MSDLFEMTDERLKKLRLDIMGNHPDVMGIKLMGRKRKKADFILKGLQANRTIKDIYRERVEQNAIVDLELFDLFQKRGVEDLPAPVVESSPAVLLPAKKRPKKKPVKVPKLVHFSPDVLSKLESLASDMDCSTSFLVRQAVDKYLKNHK